MSSFQDGDVYIAPDCGQTEMCKCSRPQPMIVKKVKHDGDAKPENRGRLFACCKTGKVNMGGCGEFFWLDEQGYLMPTTWAKKPSRGGS